MTQFMIERNFVNTNAYTMYRWTVSQLKNRPAANSMQIGEVQLLGYTNSSPQPIFIVQPTSMNVYNDGFSSAYFTAIATGSPDPTYQWKKGTNGVYVNVVDGGNVSGAQTTFLSISPVLAGDAADYVCVASNPAGSAYSAVATLGVISPLPDVTLPGDAITVFGDDTGNTTSAANLINNTTAVYISGGHGPSAQAGFPPFEGPVGAVITPSKGSTLIQGIRFYTSDANAAADPADYRLEGSSNGGASYTLISAGALSLPEARNAAGQALDPLAQAMQEILFANAQVFTSYRLTITNTKNNDATSTLRLGEIELLGLSGPTITVTPNYVNLQPGGSASFTAVASGTGTLTYQWKKGANGVYANLTDGGTVSGATTETLLLTGVTLADDGEYVVQVTDSVLPATSQPVIVNLVSSGQDVTVPGDVISSFSGTAPDAEGVVHAIDNLTDKYLNFGTDGNTDAPFVGPVGFVVTPAATPTTVTGLRIYAANDAPERDPADYQLEGSNDGGGSYTVIAAGPVLLPVDRNAGGAPVDPLAQVNREIRFPNTRAYATYRFSITNVRNNAQANSMQLGEVELLGTVAPSLTITPGTGGSFTITSSMAGTLWSATELKEAGTVWSDEGPIAGSVNITPNPAQPQKFYRVTVP